MKRKIFYIVYKLHFYKLACKISPSLYYYEEGKKMVEELQEELNG